MLLASSIRALIFLPNVRFYKTNFESRIQKKIHLNLNASSSRSLFSLSTFSTIPQQLHTIDDQTVQENYYIPYTEKQISFKHTHLEASEKETGGKNDPSLNQNKSAENEPKGVDEYTLNVGRGNSLDLFLFYLSKFLIIRSFLFSKQFVLYEMIYHYSLNMVYLILQSIHQIFY